jgi:hypothetical protein
MMGELGKKVDEIRDRPAELQSSPQKAAPSPQVSFNSGISVPV